MDTTKRPLRLTAPSLLPYLLADWGATDGTVLVNSLLLLLDCSAIAMDKLADRTGDQYGSLSLTMPPLFIQELGPGSYKSRVYGRALSGGDVDFRTRVLLAFINCARGRTAGAAHHEKFSNPRCRAPMGLQAGVPPCSDCQSSAAVACYSATARRRSTPTYAAAEEKKRVVNCVSIQRPPIEDIIHGKASHCSGQDSGVVSEGGERLVQSITWF
ncbi:hypothetical protein DAI22_01g248900 [Oryza sativa Japonica Group]|nr:hypothetical protein DAI22_01g248900 [Oryza sativa Japonica Group]